MNDTDDKYSDKASNSGDWYVSVRVWQMVLCAILTLVLCLTFHFGNDGALKSGYKYLTDSTISADEISDAVNSVVSRLGKIVDA